MSASPSLRTKPNPSEVSQLRAEIRALGSTLGRTVAKMEGPEVLESVERLRKAAKAVREGDGKATAVLASEVAGLDPKAAYLRALAFTLYFELVNLAEENFRIRLLRLRRAERRRHPSAQPPMRESIEAAVLELKQRGVSADEMQALVNRISIELVFTAHPTESKRRTLLTKLQRLAGLLRQGHDADWGDAAFDPQAREREILSLWLTDRSRVARPEVTDEARTGLWYFETTLFETLPRLQVDLEAALHRHYPTVTAPKRWLTFGSWIGGDRDGNPNVTAKVTTDVLLQHRRLAAERLRQSADTLSRSLSISDRREPPPAALRKLVRESKHLSATLEKLGSRYPSEPYRLILAGVRERLEQVRAESRAGSLLSAAATAGEPLFSGEAVRETLAAVRQALAAGRAAMLVDGELKFMQDQADIFGLHVARLDIRQHSSPHEAAVAELLGRPDYPKLAEEAKLALLAEALPAAQPLSDADLGQLTAATRHVVEPIVLTGVVQATLGLDALGIYIISMTDAVSDVLEVLYLQKRGRGAHLPVAPLFETLDDLERAPEILRGLFQHPLYRGEIARHQGHQHVMLGYSDSNKDCGYLTANWALFQAQETIADVCREHRVRVTLFHGRGGSIARGGGPAAKAILAQPVGLRDGGIRVTEQGEVLSTRYHDPDLAHRILEQMAYGVMLGIHAADHPAPLRADWRESMAAMSQAALEAYQSLVHRDPDFLSFWKQATPIDEISNLKLGSRPTFRRNTTSVEDLRAIPWVFSWMQSRFVFPGWFGLGSGLNHLLARGPGGRKLLREMYESWPFFQTLIDNAQLTLRKTDLGIARLYAGLVENAAVRSRILGIIERELTATEEAILAITGQKQLLAQEPVLLRSIQLRNPYIDPLNFIQVEMLRRLRSGTLTKDEEEGARAVVELTINGISGGLKNTG